MGSHFTLGPWLVQPSLNAADRNGTTSHVTPKAMEVLVCLAQHAGEPVTKEELLRTVWPDAFVGDDVIKRSIAELRRVFEDDVKEPQFIQTIAKRGYRLIATVEWIDTGQQGAVAQHKPEIVQEPVSARNHRLWLVGAAIGCVVMIFVFLGAFDLGGLRTRLKGTTTPQIRSIAVLPLQNLSGDPAQEYFSDGMTDALITDLAQLGSVKVISRTSSMQYKQSKKSLPEIAGELNVDGIVEGAVQRSGDRVRITAQLIHGPSDKHLWAGSYERDMRDIFALERDVTAEITEQVRAQLRTQSNGERAKTLTINPKALDLYLKGNYYLVHGEFGLSDEEKGKAADFFQQAIALEPNFAPAYIGLADAHSALLMGSSEDISIRRKAAEKALALDANSSDALVILADIRWMNFDWPGAEQEYRQAVALNPNSASAHEGLGYLLGAIGRLDEGLHEATIAQELDPNEGHLDTILEWRGEYDRAIELDQKIVGSHPDETIVHYQLYRLYAAKGTHQEAIEELVRATNLFGWSDLGSNLHHAFTTSGYQGAMKAWAKALEKMQAAKQAFLPENLAAAYAAIGDRDRAFYWLEQGYEHREMVSHDWGLCILKVDPLLAPLRSDPRFGDLLRRVGLQQ
jgi:TolB-like protein/DNA-binding winged helix-turn-helix (wHTH) protein/tetratricopeptide (TPR) repeat protein